MIFWEASLHGFYYKPRVSKKFLAEHSRGLIGLSGCLKGEVAERLMEGNYEAAREAAGTFRDIFGEKNFYLEIQDQGLAMEHRIHPGLFQLEKDLGLPLVATNDSHYLCEDDAHAQDDPAPVLVTCPGDVGIERTLLPTTLVMRPAR